MSNADNTADTFIGRCKKCKTARRVVAPVVRDYMANIGYGRTERKVYRSIPGTDRTIEAYSRFYLPCETCEPNQFGARRPVEFNRIIGRASRHECGAKCMNSTGFVCECSCKGANHGCSVVLEVG